jgi:hypothetical protein
MPRCVTQALALLLPFVLAAPVAAQLQRNFPATALRGELRVLQPPEVLLNGRAARLAPGARIRGDDNMLLMSGAITGQPLRVHYTLDTVGGVLDVWVLTALERARQPWPVTLEQAQSWSFDFSAQTWSRP